MKLVNLKQLFLVVIISLSAMAAVSAMKSKKAGTVFEFLEKVRASNSTGNETKPKSLSGDNLNASLVVDLNDPNIIIENWASIESDQFANEEKYPRVKSKSKEYQVKLNEKYERLNLAYKPGSTDPPKKDQFWFRARGGYIYYTNTKSDINVLGSIFIKRFEDSQKEIKIEEKQGNYTFTVPIKPCVEVEDLYKTSFTICYETEELKNKWLCSMQNYLKYVTFNPTCLEGYSANFTLQKPQIVVVNITQPLMIIPQEAPQCNEKWNYESKGEDWQCICGEGRSQSPINLPSKDKATLSPLQPLFQYEVIPNVNKISSIDGIVTEAEHIKMRYFNYAIKILGNDLGKIVTLDGAVYIAEEIIFHNPSEHKIEGQSYDMEMQIIHYGRTKGDISKQVVFSFLFKSTPGVYNKFIDSLDFFNLPNKIDKERDMFQDLYVPNIFYRTDDDEIPVFKPFSFYTYEGSITFPPCTERTTHFVAADPIELTPTAISLFKEALKVPDQMSTKGDIVLSPEENTENNRDVMPLNGREVFIYDHKKFNCPEYKRRVKHIQPAGHYEKHIKPMTTYIWVNGVEPSGIPGSFVVSEQEAKGEEKYKIKNSEAV